MDIQALKPKMTKVNYNSTPVAVMEALEKLRLNLIFNF